ncbi:MAG: hypothetical protein RIS70_988 [Planctomycetota bacterium]|jgi:hypothetical protein
MLAGRLNPRSDRSLDGSIITETGLETSPLELPIGRFLKFMSLGDRRLILIVRAATMTKGRYCQGGLQHGS